MHARLSAIVVAVASVIGVATASATDPTPVAAPPGGEMLNLDQYLTGGTDRSGSFPGKVVCMPPRASFAPAAAEPCADRQIYALLMPDDVAVPLKAGTDAARAAMSAARDQQVVVRGKHSPQTGVITAGTIESAGSAVEAPD